MGLVVDVAGPVSGPATGPGVVSLLCGVTLILLVALGTVGCGGERADAPIGQPSVVTAPVGTVAPSEAPTGSTPTRSTPTRSTGSPATVEPLEPNGPAQTVRSGAEVLLDGSLELLSDKRVGLITNRSAVVGGRPLVDVFHRSPSVDLQALFAAEHGLRADAPAGAEVLDGFDPATGLVVHSLYDGDRAPTQQSLADLDVLVFDLQDVGARFYTYTATMGLAMQAAAKADIPFVILDRPNPLGGDRPDGAVLVPGSSSFVGPYPVPALHGLTAGELARAIQGEGWLDDLDDLDLQVVAVEGWRRVDRWDDHFGPWVPPSPGLPTVDSALVYPATVLFEATTVSFGQGTDRPFTQIGAPWLDPEALIDSVGPLAGLELGPVVFTPEAGPAAAEPRYSGRTVPGVGLVVTDRSAVRPWAAGVRLLSAVLAQAAEAEDAPIVIDRPSFFDLLAGGPDLRRSIEAGAAADEIIASWDDDLARWNATRARYLLY